MIITERLPSKGTLLQFFMFLSKSKQQFNTSIKSTVIYKFNANVITFYYSQSSYLVLFLS